MRRVSVSSVAALACLLAIACANTSVFAQHGPVLKFSPIINKWPTVELHYAIGCDSIQPGAIGKDQIHIRENGLDVDEFVVTCADTVHNGLSVALVFDASYSMMNPRNKTVKAAGNKFVDLMHPLFDEAAVVYFSDSVTLRLPMTSDTDSLHDAVNGLPIHGGTALWDGVMLGVDEVVRGAVNHSTAVIVVTDGFDNMSKHTMREVCDYALDKNVRVFTIGIGNSLELDSLKYIADKTGGHFYYEDLAQMNSVYEDIFLRTNIGFTVCSLSYQSQCADGGLRIVELTIDSICGGSATRSRSYIAPVDTGGREPLPIAIGSAKVLPGESWLVPVHLRYPGTRLFRFETFSACVKYDTAVCSFGMPWTKGTQLANTQVFASTRNDSVFITSYQRTILGSDNKTPLLYLRFAAKNRPLTKHSSIIDLGPWVFDYGCKVADIAPGTFEVVDSNNPTVLFIQGGNACEGDTVTLRVSVEPATYRWSTGATSPTIKVSRSGDYWYDATLIGGQTVRSDTLHLQLVPAPKPNITPMGSPAFCEGDSVILFTQGKWVAYEWSTGETTPVIAARKSGFYSVRVMNAGGCWGGSEPFQVIVNPKPHPDIKGASVVCNSDTVFTYRVSRMYNCRYDWTTTAGSVVGEPADSIQIRWDSNGMHILTIVQTDTMSGCSTMDSISINVGAVQAVLNYGGDYLLCPGDTITLKLQEKYDSYLWSNGATAPEIRVTKPGNYFCTVGFGPCNGVSSLLRVVLFDSSAIQIEGPNGPCTNDIAIYSILEQQGITYEWSVERGTLMGRNDRASIAVQWDSGAGNGMVTVLARHRDCSAHAERAIHIFEGIPPQITSSGDTVFCQGDTITLEAEEGYTDYVWSTGARERRIAVIDSGLYSVTATSPQGCRLKSREILIHSVPPPPVPSVLVRGDTLYCRSEGMHYQWLKNGVPIPGATAQWYLPTEDGEYSVIITDEHGCSSISGITRVENGVGIENPVSIVRRFDVAPNPGTGVFAVALDFETPASFELTVTDLRGRVISRSQSSGMVKSYLGKIDLRGMPAGAYFISVQTQSGSQRKKLVVQ